MPEFMQVIDNWNGYVGVRERGPRFNQQAVAEALELFGNTARMPSHRHEYLIREALTTSDFASLFAFVIDRQLLAKYQVWVPDWRQYCATGTVINFNAAEVHKVYGNDTYLPRVAERGPYLAVTPGTGKYTRQVFKHGRSFAISFEATVNDFLSAFADIPDRFANAAIRTQARDVTSIYAAAAGPNPALFGATITDVDGQAITNQGVLPLTITNLETTLALMGVQTDPTGEPISVRGIHLVVPPAMEFNARSILMSSWVAQVEQAGAANAVPTNFVPLPTANILPSMGIKLHVDPFLPVVDTSGNKNGTWYVFAEPSQGRAMQMDFLRGYEAPEICLKMSNKLLAGGGVVSPMDGDFDSDDIQYRVREIHGGVALDPRYAYAQVHT